MPEFFLELFSEEIPARMQADAAQELAKICRGTLADLLPHEERISVGPRRIAFAATIAAETSGGLVEARGPRDSAPAAALAGFMGKYNATAEDAVAEGGYFWFRRNAEAVPAMRLIADALPAALAAFRWPKSMRWGQAGDFTWVRPLRRLTCLLDGEIVPVTLGPLRASNVTEGHRVLGTGAFAVSSAADWAEKLRGQFVIADQDERRKIIFDGITEKAAALGLHVAEDKSLLDDVTGLVEWPVPLIGRIDEKFMDLPPELRELSMKINQKYFALRDEAGNPAPYFAFVANLAAPDGGAAIIAGNERVLRARLSDARHFWDLDLKTSLSDLLPKLQAITFHAKIGNQFSRAERMSHLARRIAGALGGSEDEQIQAGCAGLLAKADLVTGMVGEFPELQGVMGGYYAERNPHGWDGAVVGPAIKTHYQPKGPSDAVPTGLVAVSVALADKLDTLIEFFRIGETPTGSGDPYALRRAALGVIRIITENQLRLKLQPILANQTLFDFIIERLRVLLRTAGKRHDIVTAVLAAGEDDDLVRLLQKADALAAMLATEDGASLLTAYRRAANILKIEEAKDKTRYDAAFDPHAFVLPEEKNLGAALISLASPVEGLDSLTQFASILEGFSTLRRPVDAFFDAVTVNDPDQALRRNRLQCLAKLRETMHQVADFSKIEG